jgi:hypothetical protein
MLFTNKWYEDYAFADFHSGFAVLVRLALVFTSPLTKIYRASVVGLASAPKLPCRDFDRSASTTLGLATIGIVNGTTPSLLAN